MAASKSTTDSEKTKKVGIQKKEWFDAGTSRNIQLSYPKLPKYESLAIAVTEYDQTMMQIGHVETLLSVWPKD